MNIAIIFAGGVGQRMKSAVPKQFLTVYGRPIIIHTLERFEDHPEIDKIYVACKKELIPYLKKLVKKYRITKIPKNGIVPGGETGQDSIYNGLCAAAKENDDNSIVLIHDGVRPIIAEEVISKNIESVKKFGSAITCTPAFETPLISYDGKNIDDMPKRKFVYTAQAPQSFRLGDVLKVHEETRKSNPAYTDVVDTCTLMRNSGFNVNIIEGNRGNIKVTTAEDYIDLLARFTADDQKQIFDLRTENEVAKRALRKGEVK
jgi:2-C-methyl-D-erythritol 4-phosphate cytidylyltransferase